MDHTQNLKNLDLRVAKGFGDQWSFFRQERLSDQDLKKIFDIYFQLFPWDKLSNPSSEGVDIGCGSGRWAKFVAPKVRLLHCLEASERALQVAKRTLKEHKNVYFELGSVGDLPYSDGSLDFAYCLGVLHHIPDPQAGLESIHKKLKKGAPFLFYIYYAFDNRGAFYRGLWKLSDWGRRLISRLPFWVKVFSKPTYCGLIYWPMARLGNLFAKMGILHPSWALAFYADKPFYVMRTDALDRFGTRLEKRYSQTEIRNMLEAAGFENIQFATCAPYWVGIAEA